MGNEPGNDDYVMMLARDMQEGTGAVATEDVPKTTVTLPDVLCILAAHPRHRKTGSLEAAYASFNSAVKITNKTA